MKYTSVNKLFDFIFHDGELDFESFENKELVISARHLNVSKNAPQNPEDEDMEIEKALITFRNFCLKSIKRVAEYEKREDGCVVASKHEIIEGEKAIEMFLSELKENGLTVYSLDVFEDNLYYLDAFGEDPFFTSFFTFDEVSVQWDNFLKPAWYELHKVFKETVILETKQGEKRAELSLDYNGEVRCYEVLRKQNYPAVNITLEFDSQLYRGKGNDYLWIDAFAHLQKNLPEGVRLKGCLVCRHGNLCPFGNEPGRVYCTKDCEINSKEDMINLFSEEEEKILNRLRKYTHICEAFCHQSEDFYTYNDYLFQLNKQATVQ